MDEAVGTDSGGRLAYRIRTAEPGDDAALRAAIGVTLAHPDQAGKRESYRGAATRGELFILERFDRQERVWRAAGFVEYHLRVDGTLTIRDVGNAGSEPQVGMVRYLVDELFSAHRVSRAQVKIRRDARVWLEIFRAIPGFYLESEEYRRPHYWTVWLWERERAREEAQAQPERSRPGPRRPTPPRPPAAGAAPGPARGGERRPGPRDARPGAGPEGRSPDGERSRAAGGPRPGPAPRRDSAPRPNGAAGQRPAR